MSDCQSDYIDYQVVMPEHRVFYRRHLPHWQPAGATLFVTFRLAGSLPRSVIAELQADRDRRERQLARISDPEKRQQEAYLGRRRSFGLWDRALDIFNHSPRWLSRPQIGNVIVEALHYRDGHVYDLVAFCVMPNHVHLVCTLLMQQDGTYHPIHRVLQSLKRHTARQANIMLGRQGSFWRAESYDHVVRDTAELERIVRYVVGNPVKAGLVSEWRSWPWTYCRSDWQSDLLDEGE